MHSFLLKRTTVPDASSERSSKKLKNTKHHKTSKLIDSAFSANQVSQCVKENKQTSSSNSQCQNPFSLSTPKPPLSFLNKQNRVKTDSSVVSSTQSVLKTVSGKSTLSNVTYSLQKKSVAETKPTSNKCDIVEVPGSGSSNGQGRKISSFFSSNSNKTNNVHNTVGGGSTDSSHQMKENMAVFAPSTPRVENYSNSNRIICKDNQSEVFARVPASLRSISAVNIDLPVESADEVQEVSEDLIGGNVDINDGIRADLPTYSAKSDPVEQQGRDEEAGEEEDLDADNNTPTPPPIVPYLIPNLLPRTNIAHSGGDTEGASVSLRASGVIRNQISPFTQNPKDFSHSARFLLGVSPSRLASLVGSKMHAVVAPEARVELLNTPRETRYGTAATRKGGVTCVKFDKGGVLCAVGSSNGVLRVYDFDEVTFALQVAANFEIVCDPEGVSGERQQARVHPMVHFPGPGRDIADICWLPALVPGAGEDDEEGKGNEDDEDEVAVAFTYSPTVHIYDLNTLDRTHCLQASQERGGGNCCVVCLPPSLSSRLKHFHRILAGGANGMLRHWKVPRAATEGGGGPPQGSLGGRCGLNRCRKQVSAYFLFIGKGIVSA
jgi:hypothetical protein